MTEVHGFVDEKFAAVRDRFVYNFEKKDDVGACVAISVEGEMVVDLWAGYKDAAATQPWEEDTIVNVYSSTKTMAAMCALLLADRGQLDLYAPVADVWPEFAQNGKEQIAMRHFLSHSAGLSGLDQLFKGDAIYDWEAVVNALAQQAPWWEPGTGSGYHAMTQGHLIGEVVRRVTGKTLGTYFREEIAVPMGADFFIGTPEQEWHRIGELIPPPNPLAGQEGGDSDSLAARTFNSPRVNAKDSGSAAWRLAEIPAANGHGNARGIVRAQTPMANGGKGFGVELLSEAGIARVFDEQSYGKDLVLGVPLRFGMGYGLTGNEIPMGPNKRIAYWGGWGGSSVVIDQDAHMCVSYVMNRMYPGTLGDTPQFWAIAVGLWVFVGWLNALLICSKDMVVSAEVALTGVFKRFKAQR